MSRYAFENLDEYWDNHTATDADTQKGFPIVKTIGIKGAAFHTVVIQSLGIVAMSFMWDDQLMLSARCTVR